MKKFATISILLLSVFLLSSCSAKKSEVVDLNKPLDQQVVTKNKDSKANTEDTDSAEVKLEEGLAKEEELDAEIAKQKAPLSKGDDLDTLDKELNDTQILNEDFSDL